MSKFLDLEGLGYYTSTFKPALVEIVDSFAKNKADWTGGTSSTDGEALVTDKAITLSVNTYVTSFKTTATEGTTTITFKSGSTTNGTITIDNATGNTISGEVELTSDVDKFTVISSKACTITEFMICTKAFWNVSQNYVIYSA